MTVTARKRRGYRTGHCTFGNPPEHGRCAYAITPTLKCACGCHTPPTTEDVRP